MELDYGSCAGDGISGGEYNRAILLGRLVDFLSDPSNYTRAQSGMLSAPIEDQKLLEEALSNLQAGIDQGNEAVDAVLQHAKIFCGQITYGDGSIEVDVEFFGDDDEQ